MSRLPDPAFWRGRRVLLTGHTGFKGAWLTLWLSRLGAEVTGFALPAEPGSLAALAGSENGLAARHGDIRDPCAVEAAFAASQPEMVLHLAAQPLVRRGVAEPVVTFATNVMGTVHVLEQARRCAHTCAVVVVTSDKCYAPGPRAHREADALGGDDPYSASKACAELATAAWRRSLPGPALATARAGNVIGGGDIASDRLVPDCIHAWSRGETVTLRSPKATRPWQYVLDALCGYLVLAEQLAALEGFDAAWNFGPRAVESLPVREVVRLLASHWPGARWAEPSTPPEVEAMQLAVDATQARERLGWAPRLALPEALAAVVAWHRAADPVRACEDALASYLAMA